MFVLSTPASTQTFGSLLPPSVDAVVAASVTGICIVSIESTELLQSAFSSRVGDDNNSEFINLSMATAVGESSADAVVDVGVDGISWEDPSFWGEPLHTSPVMLHAMVLPRGSLAETCADVVSKGTPALLVVVVGLLF